MFRRPIKQMRFRRNFGGDFSKKFKISKFKSKSKKTNVKSIFNNISLMKSINSRKIISNFVSNTTLSNTIKSNKLVTRTRKRTDYESNKIFLRGRQIEVPSKLSLKKNKGVRITKPLTKARVVPVIKTSPTGNVLERHHISYQVKGGVNVKKRTKL